MPTTCIARLIFPNYTTIITFDRVHVMKLILVQLSHSSCTSSSLSLSGPNILLDTCFWHMRSLCMSFRYNKVQISHQFFKGGKVIVLHILICGFLWMEHNHKRYINYPGALRRILKAEKFNSWQIMVSNPIGMQEMKCSIRNPQKCKWLDLSTRLVPNVMAPAVM
jgi:hypothetical protein